MRYNYILMRFIQPWGVISLRENKKTNHSSGKFQIKKKNVSNKDIGVSRNVFTQYIRLLLIQFIC